MSVDMTGWSASKKTKYNLLTRAFDENRGPQVILLIQWRVAAEKHCHDRGALIAAAIFEHENEGQPQALRALNLISERLGQRVAYRDTVKAADVDQVEAFFDEMEEQSHPGEERKFQFN